MEAHGVSGQELLGHGALKEESGLRGVFGKEVQGIGEGDDVEATEPGLGAGGEQRRVV